MASTLDNIIKQVTTDLKIATSKTVHGTVNSVISGRKVDPAVIGKVSNTVIDRMVGGMVNNATQAVNQTVARALGKKFKNSALNMIAGNYVASVLTQVITGRQTSSISARMTNAVSQGISQELFARLPKSLTKSIDINVLGTKFNTGLSPIISKAVNDTVGAVVNSVFSSAGGSGARMPSIGGIDNPLPSIANTFVPNTSGLGNIFGNLSGALGSLAGSLGSAVNNIASSIGLGSTNPISEMSLPAGLDMTRFDAPTSGVGKLVELASSPLGEITKVRGLERKEFEDIQKQLVNDNISNPLASEGGSFQNLSDVINGEKTSSGKRSIIKDLTSRFSDINTDFGVLNSQEKSAVEAAAKSTIDIGKAAAKSAAADAKSFNPTAPDQLEKLTTVKEGFRDPNAKFPLPDYANRTETNKLSTGDTSNTIVEQKNDSRMRGAQLPNGGSWDQPVSPFNAKYPYNHVRETESGHVVELDDTPGAERIHVYHKSGTFTEVDSIGNRVQVIKGSDYTIIDANGYISIQGKANVSVTGSCNVFIGADANIEVMGNANLKSHNNIDLNAAGRIKIAAGEGIDIKSPEIFLDADNQLQINSDINTKIHSKEFNLIVDTDYKIDVHNDYRMTVDNNYDVKVKGVTKHYSIKDYHIKTDKNYNTTVKLTHSITAGNDIRQRCEDSFYTSAGNTHNIQAGNMFAADAASVWFNSGASSYVSPVTAAQAKDALALETEYCDANYISGRAGRAENNIEDRFAISHSVSKIAGILTASNGNISNESKAALIEDYGVDPAALNRKPVTLETADISKNSAPVILPDELPLGDTEFPGNWKLSPNFTIENFTTGATEVAKLSSIGEAMPISKIVANLQYLALNVMEPISAARPDVVIHTGFQQYDPNTQSEYSRNNFGLSVTLDFKNAATFDDYFEASKLIGKIIPYDEMTLSYLSPELTGSNAQHGLIKIDVPGVFYPEVKTVEAAQTLQQWSSVSNKQKLKTMYNGKVVSSSSIVRVS